MRDLSRLSRKSKTNANQIIHMLDGAGKVDAVDLYHWPPPCWPP
jgi:hypothetical protein